MCRCIKAALLPAIANVSYTFCTRALTNLTKPNFGENFPVAISTNKLVTKTLQVDIFIQNIYLLLYLYSYFRYKKNNTIICKCIGGIRILHQYNNNFRQQTSHKNITGQQLYAKCKFFNHLYFRFEKNNTIICKCIGGIRILHQYSTYFDITR